MKRILLCVLLILPILPLSAQSDALKAMASGIRNEMVQDGYRILTQNWNDVNENRPISSGNLQLQSGRQYAVVFLFDGRASSKLMLYTKDGYTEPKSDWRCIQNVTRIITSFDRFSGSAEIRGEINEAHWHSGVLIVGVK